MPGQKKSYSRNRVPNAEQKTRTSSKKDIGYRPRKDKPQKIIPYAELDELLGKYVGCATGNGDAASLLIIEKEIKDICSQPQLVPHLIKFALKKPKDQRPILAELFGQKDVLALLAENARFDSDVAKAWFQFGGYADLMEEVGAYQSRLKQSETIDTSSPLPTNIEAEKIALQTDLQIAKKRIRRLEGEMASIQAAAGTDKLVQIISAVVPALNELSMYIPAMEQAGIDPDAIAGYSGSIQAISDALIESGASMVGSAGEEVEYDPILHFCQSRVSKGTQVLIVFPGYCVDDDVIIQAVVEKMED